MKVLESIKDLPEGKSIYSCQLERLLHISGPKLRSLIRELRREGKPIVATSKGYFYGDVLTAAEDLERRAYNMLKTASNMRKNYKGEQLNIFNQINNN